MSRNRSLRLVPLVAALLFASAACGSSGTEGTTAAAHTGDLSGKIRIGIAAPAASLLPPSVALANGHFKEQGLDDVEISFIPGPQLVPAAAGGQVEIAIASAPAADLIALNGQKVKVAATWLLQPGQYLVGGPGIKSVEDLKGKRVGINGSKGGSSSMLMTYALSQAGMDFNDVNLSVLQDATSQVQAFGAGQIDAMVTFPPLVGKVIKQRPGSSIIRSFEDVIFPGAQVVVNTSWAEKHADQVEAVMRAINAAMGDWRSDADGTKSVIAKELKLAATDPVVQELYDYTLEIFETKLVPVDATVERKLFDLVRANGFPEATDAAAAKVIAPDYAERALKN